MALCLCVCNVHFVPTPFFDRNTHWLFPVSQTVWKVKRLKKTTTELMPYNYFLADYILIYIIFNLFLYIIISRQAIFSRFVSREVFSLGVCFSVLIYAFMTEEFIYEDSVIKAVHGSSSWNFSLIGIQITHVLDNCGGRSAGSTVSWIHLFWRTD